jgi:hypothetical protein
VVASEFPALSAVVGSDILGSMRERGLRMVGWDYMLTSDAKRAFVGRAEAGFRGKSESSLPGGGRAFRRGRHGLHSLE